MAFTEFYCDASTGANINAGDKTANGVVTSTNGGWSTVTNIFTATGGTPFSGVTVGDFAALYADATTPAVYIARVTAVGGGGLTLTLSATAKSGTAPVTAATGISCTTGGAWKGPNAADGFPINFVSGSMTDSAGDRPRVNMKNNATYSITAAISIVNAVVSWARYQGYTSTVADGGKAIIDGGTTGASYNLLLTSNTGPGYEFIDFIFQNNGATGLADGVVSGVAGGSVRQRFVHCVFHDIMGNGYINTAAGTGFTLEECEFYLCNKSNTVTTGAAKLLTGTMVIRCIFHDNAGTNGNGIVTAGIISVVDCVFDTNGGRGVLLTAGGSNNFIGCDFYNNGSDGVGCAASMGGGAGNYIFENCNFVKNGGWGVNIIGTGGFNATLRNCGFGSGTQVNTSGTVAAISTGNVDNIGPVTYASGVTPWVDPANGDFRINLAAAKGAGRGAFTETQASYAGTIGYPDIGAAQHLESAAAAGGSQTFA